jgi:hypothetical protein
LFCVSGPSPFPPGSSEAVSRRRFDLEQRAYELRQQGLTYRAIATWLGVTLAMAPRRVLRYERTMHTERTKKPPEERL